MNGPAPKWTTYKKNRTNMSFAGCFFVANDRTDEVGAICGSCDWHDIRLGQIDNAMIDTVRAHFHACPGEVAS